MDLHTCRPWVRAHCWSPRPSADCSCDCAAWTALRFAQGTDREAVTDGSRRWRSQTAGNAIQRDDSTPKGVADIRTRAIWNGSECSIGPASNSIRSIRLIQISATPSGNAVADFPISLSLRESRPLGAGEGTCAQPSPAATASDPPRRRVKMWSFPSENPLRRCPSGSIRARFS